MKKVACSMCLFGASIEPCSGGTVDRAAGLCPVEDRRGGYRVLGHCWCSGSPEQHVLARCTSRFAGFGSARCMWCPLSKGLLGIPVGEVVAAVKCLQKTLRDLLLQPELVYIMWYCSRNLWAEIWTTQNASFLIERTVQYDENHAGG